MNYWEQNWCAFSEKMSFETFFFPPIWFDVNEKEKNGKIPKFEISQFFGSLVETLPRNVCMHVCIFIQIHSNATH